MYRSEILFEYIEEELLLKPNTRNIEIILEKKKQQQNITLRRFFKSYV
jgi:CRISPR/Cas system-associated protein Cas10 (large subunit of type III CRISPR-Cas system)